MAENDKQTEDKIFEAATAVFEEKGMDGARMQDIANRASINKAMLHYYFRTKNRLFDAVFQKLAGKMFMKFAPVFEKDLTLEDKIRFFFREHITFLQENPMLPGFIIHELNRHPERIKKLISKIDFKNLWIALSDMHGEELRKYNITEQNFPQIMTTIAAMSIFPFAARGIIEAIFNSLGVEFNDFIEKRKKFAADFVLKAITK